MDQSLNISIIKQYFHALYTDYDQKDEAEEFFKSLLYSEPSCSSLLEILIEIIIEDPDENMKKMSVIIINQMNPDLILESIFILNQKSDPLFYQIIEILTDFIATKKCDELIQIINDTLSSSDDFSTLKAILQIISSINFKIESKEIEIEDYSKFLSIYYDHFTEFINVIMQQEESIDLNQQVFFYYFMKSFSKIILNLKDIDFFHSFASFLLHFKLNNGLFKEIIEIVVETYSFLITDSDFCIFEIIEFLDEYCKATEFIPSTSLNLFGFLFKFIPEFDVSFDINYFISNYVFTFFKFNPDLIIENTEKFLDEFDPDVFSDLPLRKFINNYSTCVRFDPLYDYIYDFANSMFDEYIESNQCEICRILNFFSTFNQSLCDKNETYIINFLTEKIPILIEKINENCEEYSFYLISVCLFIKRVINYSTSSLLEDDSIQDIVVTFLKNSLDENINSNKTVCDIIFYFCINAIVSVSRSTSIEIFNFDETESIFILSNTCRLFSEVENNTLSSTFDFLVENLSLMKIDINEFVINLWNTGSESSLYINENIFHILSTLFINCKSFEDKQDIFMDMFSIISSEVESSNDSLIDRFYLNILYLFVQTFTSALLNDSEKVPYFIDTVGKLIYQMLFNLNANNYPSYLDYSDGFDELVSRYKYYIIEVVRFIDDPDFCLESLINPFIIPVFIKLLELSNVRGFELNFTGFNCILIKFKGNENIFEVLFGFYNDFVNQSNINDYSKSNFLTSLIISKPSLLFQSFDQDFFYEVINEHFSLVKFDIHLYGLKVILEFLASAEESDVDIISAVAQSFNNRVENEELLINGKFEINFQSKSASFHYNIYNEDISIILSTIIHILDKYGIKLQMD